MAENPESGAPTPKTKVSWIRAGGTVISVLLFIWLITRFGWQELLQSLLQINLSAILISIVFALLSRLAISLRWYFLCRSNGIKISIKNAIELTFAGLYASNFLPSTIGGDVVRYLGGIQLDSQKVKCAGSLIMDRLVGMLGMVLVLPFGLVYLIPMLLEGKLPPISGTNTAYSAVLILPTALQKFIQKGKKAGIALLQQIRDWVIHPVSLLAPLLMTFLHMLMLFLIVQIIFFGMGDDISFLMIAGLYSVAYFITLIPISINGYGLQEISMTFLFVNIAGVSTSHAVIMALIIRFLMMAASLPGLVYLPKILPDQAPLKIPHNRDLHGQE
jgi:glycosyltransferase 2 family protein